MQKPKITIFHCAFIYSGGGPRTTLTCSPANIFEVMAGVARACMRGCSALVVGDTKGG